MIKRENKTDTVAFSSLEEATGEYRALCDRLNKNRAGNTRRQRIPDRLLGSTV
ncbi:MAG: hypothetical protein J6A92_00595 [Lachnospiraceae bacterium]|nr:hypothetical protein [Lachnospiraceae bacterium]